MSRGGAHRLGTTICGCPAAFRFAFSAERSVVEIGPPRHHGGGLTPGLGAGGDFARGRRDVGPLHRHRGGHHRGAHAVERRRRRPPRHVRRRPRRPQSATESAAAASGRAAGPAHPFSAFFNSASPRRSGRSSCAASARACSVGTRALRAPLYISRVSDVSVASATPASSRADPGAASTAAYRPCRRRSGAPCRSREAPTAR